MEKKVDITKISEANRQAWNEAISYHQKARNRSLHNGFLKEGFTTLDRDCDKVLIPKLKEIDLSGKIIAQLPCNNGRELLSLLKYGAKEAVGFDISDAAIAEAIELSKISKLNAKFVRTDILKIEAKYNDRFYFIYISEGSLQWFPDLEEYFRVVSRLLTKGGRLLIYEMHPFAYFFEQAYGLNRSITLDDLIPYFEHGPYSYETGMDYIGQVKYKAKQCYWYMHKMSDIINSLIKNEIDIIEIEEYNTEMANNPEIQNLQKFPLSYILVGKKK